MLAKSFGETRVNLQLSQQVRRETELHNEQVKKNRVILKTLIDCHLFLLGFFLKKKHSNFLLTNQIARLDLLGVQIAIKQLLRGRFIQTRTTEGLGLKCMARH